MISVKRFIRTYMKVSAKGGSQTDVANILGCTAANVCLRTKRLKNIGVKLPTLKRGYTGRQLNAEELNKIVDCCR